MHNRGSMRAFIQDGGRQVLGPRFFNRKKIDYRTTA